MTRDIDVTAQVDFGAVDDELLPIVQCVCGAKFASWKQILSIYRDAPWSCPQCGTRLYFRNSLRVYQVGNKP